MHISKSNKTIENTIEKKIAELNFYKIAEIPPKSRTTSKSFPYNPKLFGRVSADPQCTGLNGKLVPAKTYEVNLTAFDGHLI